MISIPYKFNEISELWANIFFFGGIISLVITILIITIIRFFPFKKRAAILEILTDNSSKFIRETTDHKGNITQAIYIHVKNNDKKRYISNCKVIVEYKNNIKNLRADNFTLNPLEYKEVMIARYSYGTVHLFDSIGGGFGTKENDISSGEPKFISINVLQEEYSLKNDYKIYVNNDKKLRLEKLNDNT